MANGKVPDIKVGAKFSVAAVGGHPRLTIDYDRRTHKFTDSYLNPKTYCIAITDFPRKKLIRESERDFSGSGASPLSKQMVLAHAISSAPQPGTAPANVGVGSAPPAAVRVPATDGGKPAGAGNGANQRAVPTGAG
ncbi:hypothetical protein DBR22_01835 [Arthrobacter sp. HMWF013]|nr:hypothetical protein DBR22_01835 [Arthrobacter sp. HMWF013]